MQESKAVQKYCEGEILTCAMNFLSSEADVKGVGRVSSTGEFHTKLGWRHTRQLACCLAEVRVLWWPDLTWGRHTQSDKKARLTRYLASMKSIRATLRKKKNYWSFWEKRFYFEEKKTPKCADYKLMQPLQDALCRWVTETHLHCC